MQENVKITLNPSEQIIQAANQTETVTAGGKTFTLKKPGILSQYRIVEVVGESAKNEVYMGMVNPILWVSEIDGEPVFQPTSKRELEALIQRIGEEGVVAIAGHIAAMAVPTDSKDSIKN